MPKSSMASWTPSSLSCTRVLMVASTSCMITPSVISSLSQAGAKPASRSARLTCATKFGC